MSKHTETAHAEHADKPAASEVDPGEGGKYTPPQTKAEQAKPLTQSEWEELVKKHCPPGTIIPDWIAVKAPKASK